LIHPRAKNRLTDIQEAIVRVLIAWCAVVLFAAVGCVSSGNASGKLSDTERLALLGKATVDATDAIKTGLGKTPGRVVDSELRSKNGKVVWEVDIVSPEGNLTEVDVDANTGVVADSEPAP
jgi:uncharacterized membrane protein YkoI